MLSKILPWDFILENPQIIDPKQFGIYSFFIDDPYLEKTIISKLPKNDQTNYAIYFGHEMTTDFIEQHFLNLSFFNDTPPMIILNAETMNLEVMEFLLEKEIDWTNRYFILFYAKSNKQLLEIAKNKKINAYLLEAPRFWEGGKLWQFCQKVSNIQYDGKVAQFALENCEHNFESFFRLIDTLKINFPNGIIDLNDLELLIPRERWDFFLLLDLFHRSPKIFFEEIIKKEIDYNWLRNLSAFMQSHLIKILFPEEIRKKNKLTKYDQTVLEMSEKLNRETVKYYLGFFSEIEILSKSNDLLLLNKLRLCAL